jgi:hypothetical protein
MVHQGRDSEVTILFQLTEIHMEHPKPIAMAAIITKHLSNHITSRNSPKHHSSLLGRRE